LIDDRGWGEVLVYSDAAISGASTLRPGYQKMLEDARNGAFDVLVAEALDRLSRDQEDVAGLYKQLSFAGVTLVTRSEGEVNELHVGLKGTMNALFLKDLADKTRRGIEGCVLNGKSGGGRAYGYEIARSHDEDGERIKGEFTINDAEANIIRQIYQEYVNGKSPRAIAIDLNKRLIGAPSGKGWTHSTIIGNRKRGTGILNNQLYIGKRVWNRHRYQKDPSTGKRISRLNPKDDWIVTNVPELRIVSDDLWQNTQEIQNTRARGTRPDARSPDWKQRRPKHLFSGLIKCASCDGGMSLVSRIYYGCSNRRNKGTCDNHLTVRLDRLEEAVLRGLQDRLLTPELTKEFVREYTVEINRLKAEATAHQQGARNKLRNLSVSIDNIVDAIAVGKTSTALLKRLDQLEREKELLKHSMGVSAPDPVRIHPNAAGIYITKVNNLRDALNVDDTRAEAVQILRTLVDEIRLHPIDGVLQIELVGDLAKLLGFASAHPTQKPGFIGNPRSTEWLVAGACYQRYLHLDYAPL